MLLKEPVRMRLAIRSQCHECHGFCRTVSQAIRDL